MALFVVIALLALLIAAVRSLLEVVNLIRFILITISRAEPNPPAPRAEPILPAPQRPGPRRRLF